MNPHTFSYESMGTHWSVSVWDEIQSAAFQELKTRIIQESQLFDETYSRFIESSFVTKLAEKTGRVEIPPDFVPMLLLYQAFYILSDGKFTPLVGTTLSDMGYDAQYSLKKQPTIRSVPPFEDVVEITDDTHINLKQSALFDFGALGKGYFIDKIVSILRKYGLNHFLVNGSGDVYYEGEEPIKIGLEHPADNSKVIGSVNLTRSAMCSSGINRRGWGKHHHIIDPESLQSSDHIIASWVTAENTAVADALATALFLCPPEVFKNKFQFEYLLLNQQMKVKRSAGFEAELF